MFHDLKDLVFFEFLAFHEFLEITIFTKLGDDVETILGAEDILEPDNVGVVEPFQEVDFRKDGVLEILIVSESRQIDLLDGNLFLGLSLHPLIYLPINPLAKAFRCLITIVADDLYYNFCHSIYYHLIPHSKHSIQN